MARPCGVPPSSRPCCCWRCRSSASPEPPHVAAAPDPAVALRVMTLNIFYGGDEIDLHTGSWCHRTAGCPETLAQVVDGDPGVGRRHRRARGGRAQRGRHRRRAGLARERADAGDLALPDRRPAGRGRPLRLGRGRARAGSSRSATSTCPSDPYGPYAIRDGASLADVLDARASVRLPAIQDQLRVLPPLAAGGMPTFLTGDFNSPSHLDWTAAVAAVRPEVPYRRRLAGQPRARRRGPARLVPRGPPDPVAVPASRGRPAAPRATRTRSTTASTGCSRAGPPTALDERRSSARPAVPTSASGHAVADRPPRRRLDVPRHAGGPRPRSWRRRRRRVFVGDTLVVRYRAAAGTGQRVAIVPAGGPVSAAVASVAVGPPAALDGTRDVRDERRCVRAPTRPCWSPGWHGRLAQPVLALPARRRRRRSATSKSTYVVGEPIDVSWARRAGHALGLARRSTRPGRPTRAGSRRRLQRELREQGPVPDVRLHEDRDRGTATFDAGAAPGTYAWPLKPGTYEVRLLVDDSYRSAASSAKFKVVKP